MTSATLRTARLVLRAVSPDDGAALFAIVSDAEAMRYWSRPPFADVAEVQAWIAPHPDWPAWAIVEDGHVVGRVTLGLRRPGVAEIGYLVARERWGRGVAGEALSALAGHAFGALGLRRLFADIDPDNRASIRVVERLGFVLEGRLRAEWETHIGVRDSLIYGLLAAEWQDRD